ncbi:MAG: ribbon-helix-helix protein, CopG family [Acidobacteriia bacterium]|nr:ribbon-helix-helix protein, CopG family [Terriglobia bacterium]
MEKQIVSFRLDSDKIEALDALAAARGCDRSCLLNEAVAAYLDIQQWKVQHIEAAILQADAGRFIRHQEVRKMAAKWRRWR